MDCSVAEFGELANEILQSGSSVRFEARGWSMHPAVRDGDVLLVGPVSMAALRTGDIVLCRTGPERLVVHRILGRRRRHGAQQFLLKGDRCSDPDGWFSGEGLLGRVTGIERGGRFTTSEGAGHRLAAHLLVWASRNNLWQVPWLAPARQLLGRLVYRHESLPWGAI
jgi:signal peptidase I